VVSWRLALVLLSVPVVIIFWMGAVGRQMKLAQMGAIDAYALSATFAEEAISSVKDVMANGTRHRFVKKYDKSLEGAMGMDYKAKHLLGIFIGGLLWSMLASFALGCWAGSRFVHAGNADVGDVVTVLLASVTASITFGSVAPSIQAFGAAGAAANRFFAILDRKPPFSSASIGEHGDGLKGRISFQDVTLMYPSRRSEYVLEQFNFDIEPGKTTAIVGPSGSGKSSLFALLERFYPPLRGQILIDGCDIEDYDLGHLRSQIKVVSQDSFIFNSSVFENIACGLAGTRFDSVSLPLSAAFPSD
jgi:ATP-binding cassette subfamily B (MDR/TAP) protein 1